MGDLDPRLRSLTGAFAVSPSHLYMAVGGSSHIHLLRLCGEDGETIPGTSLKADCSVRAPGVRRLTWSTHGHRQLSYHPEAPPPCLENDVYPVGLIAGGCNDGVVSIWEPPTLDDELGYSEDLYSRKRAYLDDFYEIKLMDDQQEEKMKKTVREMYTQFEPIRRKSFTSKIIPMPKEVLQDKHGVGFDNWELLGDDVQTWIHHKGTNKAIGAEQGVLLKMKILEGPVLGLSFNRLHPNWLAAAAYGEKVSICNLSYSMDSSCSFELSDVGSKRSDAQITGLDWNRIFPLILASTNDAGVSKIWDARNPHSSSILEQGDKKTCSDIKWSPYHPLQFAVSTIDPGSSPAVKVWDLRQVKGTLDEYGTKGVVSLSWGRGGSLLNSHIDGTISCAFPYDSKALTQLSSAHGDLGVTWCHYHDIFATLSSKSGISINQTDLIPSRSFFSSDDN